ncbi:MAG TPA: tetratricopeptide repeat protein, partial [Pyrinomonadaceae bacterium]
MKAKTRKQRFRELQAAVNQGLNASIIEMAQDYLRDFPKHGVVWLDYGNALADFAKYKEARSAFLKAIKYMPSHHLSFPYSYMGHLYESQGNYHRAAEWYRKASEANPKTSDHLIFLGATLSKMGKLSEAERCFRKAIKCKEGVIDEAYYNLGIILGGRGKYKEALA